MKQVIFVINGDKNHPMGIRGRGLVSGFKTLKYTHLYRGSLSIKNLLLFFLRIVFSRSDHLYLLDVGPAVAFPVFVSYYLMNKKFILDTGDLSYEIAKKTEGIPGWKITAIKYSEQWLEKKAAHLIVRGRLHKTYFKQKGLKKTSVIQDGVYLNLFGERVSPKRDILYKAHKSDLVVGTFGSILWNSAYLTCYGMELVQALAHLKGEHIHAVIMGGGAGLERLKRVADDLGVSEQVTFTGQIPYEEIPAYLMANDVLVSTQIKNVEGEVRTTGKLPLYLATGKFILCTNVGEAKLILPRNMLFEYQPGVEMYKTLAEKLKELANNRTLLKDGEAIKNQLAKSFDYPCLSRRLERLLVDL